MSEYRNREVCISCLSTQIHYRKITQDWKCRECKIIFKNPGIRNVMVKENKKKSTLELNIINREELVALIKKIPNAGFGVRDKALLCFLYLTGCRINEVVRKVRPDDFSFISIDNKDLLLIGNVTTLKRRKKVVKRNIPIPLIKEKEFVDMILEYLRIFHGEFLFDFTSQNAHRIVKKHFPDYSCHVFRHLRNSHLVTAYGFTDQELVKWNGWFDSKAAMFYTHLRYEDLANKMIK